MSRKKQPELIISLEADIFGMSAFLFCGMMVKDFVLVESGNTKIRQFYVLTLSRGLANFTNGAKFLPQKHQDTKLFIILGASLCLGGLSSSRSLTLISWGWNKPNHLPTLLLRLNPYPKLRDASYCAR